MSPDTVSHKDRVATCLCVGPATKPEIQISHIIAESNFMVLIFLLFDPSPFYNHQGEVNLIDLIKSTPLLWITRVESTQPGGPLLRHARLTHVSSHLDIVSTILYNALTK